MISIETLEKLALQNQTGIFPNIVCEYFQHVFLSELYKLPESGKLLFKGGTALRIVYGSPRFSEDLDFSLFRVPQNEIKSFVENLFVHVLAEMARAGIKVELGEKIGATSGGYFGVATFRMFECPPVNVEINVSARPVRGKPPVVAAAASLTRASNGARNSRVIKGEVDSVANNFVPTYTVIHLPQTELVEEKVFGALRERKKSRDFYDLYFIMRKGMLSPDQKKRLAGIKEGVIADAKIIDFRGELGAFLPADQQAIVRDFPAALERELNRQMI